MVEYNVSVLLTSDDLFEDSENFFANLAALTTLFPVKLDVAQATLNIEDASSKVCISNTEL